MSSGLTVQILIVEDVSDMRELLRTTVEMISTDTKLKVRAMAANCLEARLELSRHMFDLVLLDEILPGESSTDLLMELIQKKIPTLMITSMENPTHAVPKGALGRIRKPNWDSTRSFEEDLVEVLKKAFPQQNF